MRSGIARGFEFVLAANSGGKSPASPCRAPLVDRSVPRTQARRSHRVPDVWSLILSHYRYEP